MSLDLQSLFHPRAVAIVGASAKQRSIGEQLYRNLREVGFSGRVYPINPHYSEIDGAPCYADVGQLPEPPDLVLIAVPAAGCLDVLIAAAKRGARNAVVLSAGFAEHAAAGKGAQSEMIALAQRSGMRVLGPNCQGILNVEAGLFAGFGAPFARREYRTGTLSLATQSGGFGYSVVEMAETAGVGFRYVANTGNEVDVGVIDLLEAFVDDPGTRVLAAYVEGLRGARRLRDVADRALAARKPVLIWKVGWSDVGRRAALSHTASLAGSSEVYRAVFHERGIIEINDVDDLIDLGRAFASPRLPGGNRVAVVTVSGGAGVLAADHLAAQGIVLPPVTGATRAELAARMPNYATLDNPVDVTAQFFNVPTLMQDALATLAGSPDFDAIVMLNASLSGDLAERVAQAVIQVQAATSKPILVAWSADPQVNGAAYAVLEAHQVPRFPTPVRAARALGTLVRYRESLERHQMRCAMPPPLLDRSSLTGLRAAFAALPAMPTEHEAKMFLAAGGIPTTREEIATSAQEAAQAAQRIGFPVVLKVQSPVVLHKTDAGGVQVNLMSEADVKEAYEDILKNLRRRLGDVPVYGVLVQEQVEGGVEVILGLTHDADFGPVVLVGLGGVFAEILGDVAFRVVPVHPSETRRMIREIRGHPILAGARRRCPVDIDALAVAIDRLAAIAEIFPDEIAEVDINPLFVLPAGEGVLMGDAVLVRRRVETGDTEQQTP